MDKIEINYCIESVLKELSYIDTLLVELLDSKEYEEIVHYKGTIHDMSLSIRHGLKAEISLLRKYRKDI